MHEKKSVPKTIKDVATKFVTYFKIKILIYVTMSLITIEDLYNLHI